MTRSKQITTNFLIVGAGFSGSVMARQVADAGYTAFIIDKRPHIAGNAYDCLDANGVRIHRYGPHIFHTNAKRIFDYLSRFTEWRDYEHRVRGSVNGTLYPFPINRDTLNRLYGLDFDEAGAADYFERVREPRSPVQTSEDVVLNSVGRDLFETFFLGYTRKQWGMDPSELKAGVAARIPARTNRDDRYFTDAYQAMPKYGYTHLFENLLDHPNISLQLATSYDSIRDAIKADHVVYTGPIDAYFDYCYGQLPYRSLRFEHEHIPKTETWQATGTINYPNDYDFTRITEFKYLTGQSHSGTSIVREYPQDDGDPYYPVPRAENEKLYKRYEALAKNEPDVTFVGRLAQYRYYNMDQVVAAALKTTEKLIGSERNG